MIVVAQEGHIPDHQRGGVVTSPPCPRILTAQEMQMLERKADDIVITRAAFPASESVSGWVTPAVAAESWEDRKKIYPLKLLMGPQKVYFILQ